MITGERESMRPWAATAGLLLGLTLLTSACGEKITLPEAVGIPTSSEYLEQPSWQLTDPTDVMEADGRIFVTEGEPGTINRYSTSQELQSSESGLVNPVAMGLHRDSRTILVAEAGDAGTTPRISFFSQADLAPLGNLDLDGIAMSVAGIAVDLAVLYVSDPDSGVVHRFAFNGVDRTIETRGLVCNNQGSVESPQFVFQPEGLALTPEGRLLVCDADSTRNWVLQFDPSPPMGDDSGFGQAVPFRESGCANPPVDTFVLGAAPGCGQPFVEGPSSAPGGLSAPSGIAFDTDGRMYVADRGNDRAQRFDTSGQFNLLFGDGAGGVAPLGSPRRIATWLGSTSRDGIPIIIPGARVYVVDEAAAQLRIFEDKRWTDFQS